MTDYLSLAKTRPPKGELEHSDLVAMLEVDEERDAKQHGILGMKWGRRRTDAQLVADTKARHAAGAPVTTTAKAKAVVPDATTEHKKVVGAASGETSAARYNRLREQAKTQGANSLDEQDLKFMNARADAIAKVQKMNETQPGWLSTTSKKVLQQAAQNTMQNIADGVAKKYISGPVLDALNDNTKAIAAESKTPIDYLGKHRKKK